MKHLFALPGFHRHDRGAEVALLGVAEALACGGDEVTVMGGGQERPGKPYHFIHVPVISREGFERFPRFPPMRSETAWEDATFAAGLLRRFDASRYDVVITCSFPFTHWALRKGGRNGPLRAFVTQNGDWPAYDNTSEFRFFSCDALVCTNPDYFERNRERWNCGLIPNGIDLEGFRPGPPERERLGLPAAAPIVLMVSAFIESKRVLDGIRAVAALDGVHLVVAGDGPLRGEAEDLAQKVMPGRFHRISVPASQMPSLYRSADIFLHMSLLESFGNVFLEAWACGLPIVAHDTERLRWILGPDSPFLCDTQNTPALGNSIAAALACGEKAPAGNLQRFSWATIAGDYRAFFAETLERRSVA